MNSYNRAIIAHIGPMFGGKTSALLSDVRRMKIAGYNTCLFKPVKDIRYSKDEVVNHDKDKYSAINVECFEDIVHYCNEHKDITAIAIDELQFIENIPKSANKDFLENKIDLKEFIEHSFGIDEFIQYIHKENKTLVISGLDLTSELTPFKNIKDILPYATHINKHKAICLCCGNNATTSYCKKEKKDIYLLGEKDIYEPRCITCYFERRN